MLCSCHSIVFGAQFTCISTVKNVHTNTNSLLLPLYCFRCSIYVHFHGEECACELTCSAPATLLFSVLNYSAPTSSYLCCDVLCACCGLPMKKPFAWMRDFAWQPNFPTDCRTVPTNLILHPIGVSLRPFVSSVTYVLRTRTPNTVISCQPNIFTLRLYQQLKQKRKKVDIPFTKIISTLRMHADLQVSRDSVVGILIGLDGPGFK
jgi:hypothetical protein